MKTANPDVIARQKRLEKEKERQQAEAQVILLEMKELNDNGYFRYKLLAILDDIAEELKKPRPIRT